MDQYCIVEVHPEGIHPEGLVPDLMDPANAKRTP